MTHQKKESAAVVWFAHDNFHKKNTKAVHIHLCGVKPVKGIFRSHVTHVIISTTNVTKKSLIAIIGSEIVRNLSGSCSNLHHMLGLVANKNLAKPKVRDFGFEFTVVQQNILWF